MTEFFDGKLINEEGLVVDKQTQSPFTGNCEVDGAKGSILNGYFTGKWQFSEDFLINLDHKINRKLFNRSGYTISLDTNIWKFYPMDITWDRSTITYEIDFLKNRLSGFKKVYVSEEKKLLSSQQFQDSILHGESKVFNNDGKVIILENYENGILHGPIKYSDTNDDSYLLEGHFINGVRDGLWKFNHYHLREYDHKNINYEGSMSFQPSYYGNKFHLTSKNENGSIKDRESWCLSKLIKKTMDDDKFHSWDFNYDKTTFKEANYKNNRLDGMAKEYFSNGKISRISHYSNGEKEGVEKVFDEDGALMLQENYKFFVTRSLKHGTYERYHPNGKIRAQGQYVRGHNDGVWKFFDETGTQTSEKIYSAEKDERELSERVNRSRAISSGISDVIGGSAFMTDTEKDVFGD